MSCLFVASTGKNVGKTTVSLGLMAGLQKRFGSLGYLKPVGQQWVEATGGLKVDKDILLFKEQFGLDLNPEEMSPVLLPKPFTRQYLDGKIDEKDLIEKIRSAYGKIKDAKEFTLIEGTGHIGVGSIINLNNAQVAAELGVPIIIVAPGGVGFSYDQLALNHALCQLHGARLIGVILNKVIPNKLEMVESYMSKALKRWDIPLLGTIPFNDFLSTPTLKDFELLFETKLIAGVQDRLYHFRDVRMVATSVEVYERSIESEQLIITHAAREGVILATLKTYLEHKETNQEMKLAMIITDHPPRKPIVDEIIKADLPCLISPLDSFETMQKITTNVSKIGRDDTEKINAAIQTVEGSVDFDRLIQKL